MLSFVPEPAPAFSAAWKADPKSLLIFLNGNDIVLQCRDGAASLPEAASVTAFYGRDALKTGRLGDRTVYAAEADPLPDDLPAGLERVPFRIATGRLAPDVLPAVFRGKELLFWRKQHRLCGACGAKLSSSETDVALVCPACGMHYYPQIAPAVIVAVLREGKILLAHNKRFQPGIFGLIAGFVEAGESAENAITREVREETGIEVGNIRYFSSQCWPFPNSLMLGYFADYVSGEAKADGIELETLGWYDPDAMPSIPPPGSIARRMIEHYLSNMR